MSKDYRHLCNCQEAHRMYHVVGEVCPCPEPCKLCGHFDLDEMKYCPSPIAIRRNQDYTPMWLCGLCSADHSAYTNEEDGFFFSDPDEFEW